VVGVMGLASADVVKYSADLHELHVYVVALILEPPRYPDGYLRHVQTVVDDVAGGADPAKQVDSFVPAGDGQVSSSSLISAIFFSRNSMTGALSALCSGSSQNGQWNTVSMASSKVVLGHWGFPQW